MSIQIFGEFTGVNQKYNRPYLEYDVTQNLIENYSDVTVRLYFAKYLNGYGSFNLNTSSSGHQCNSNINNDQSQVVSTFDLRSGSTATVLVRTRQLRVYHNVDGTKSCFIGFNGSTLTSLANYRFGETVTLPSIPREAIITNPSLSFVIGESLPLTINNPGNMYLRALLYVNNELIKTTDLGQVTSATLTFNDVEKSAMYEQMPNSLQAQMFVRLKSYQNSGYSIVVGSDRDKAGAVYLDSYTNRPTFSTYTVENVSKLVRVVDKYENNLLDSYTDILLGASNKIIKGYSKIRATIAAANKAIALNSATMNRYRLVAGNKQAESIYSDVDDVTIEIDNVDVIDNSVSALDSRSLSMTVGSAFVLMADYAPPTIFNVVLARDNSVDEETKLQFSGQFWNKYFSSGTAVNPGSGVLNTLKVEYRYKEKTDAWGSQPWIEITPSVDANGVITFDDYIDGDLGANRFDVDKSFNIEVRAYDKLGVNIADGILDVGTPLLDLTKNAIAVKGKVDLADSSALQIDGSITLRQSETPSDPDSDSEIKTYTKGSLVIFQYNDGGTIRYKYLDMAGTSTIWTHTTTAP